MNDDLISRQDAIEALIQEFYSNVDDYISEKQAVHAIDSLPSAQLEERTKERTKKRTETHACDLIKRQAAIEAAVEAADEWDGGYSRSREEIITLKLRMLPSSNKSGHWVMNPSEVAGDGYYICSNCNNDVYDATDFCPNCGSYNGGESDDKG